MIANLDHETSADNLRSETSIDAIATLVQIGHRDRKTSHEVARSIWALVAGMEKPE